jgi:hypothetical protein
MVIIIIISGIIVFGTIRISNYYHTENIEEISSSHCSQLGPVRE